MNTRSRAARMHNLLHPNYLSIENRTNTHLTLFEWSYVSIGNLKLICFPLMMSIGIVHTKLNLFYTFVLQYGGRQAGTLMQCVPSDIREEDFNHSFQINVQSILAPHYLKQLPPPSRGCNCISCFIIHRKLFYFLKCILTKLSTCGLNKFWV